MFGESNSRFCVNAAEMAQLIIFMVQKTCFGCVSFYVITKYNFHTRSFLANHVKHAAKYKSRRAVCLNRIVLKDVTNDGGSVGTVSRQQYDVVLRLPVRDVQLVAICRSLWNRLRHLLLRRRKRLAPQHAVESVDISDS